MLFRSQPVTATTTLGDLKADLTVEAVYSDGTSEVITAGYELSGSLAAGKLCTVTVTYGGKNATFTVRVSELTTDPEELGFKAEFTGGSQSAVVFTSTRLDSLKELITVTVTVNGVDKALSASEYSLEGELTAGESVITVKHNGLADVTCTITVTVTAVEITSITATFAQGGNIIYTSASLDDLRGMLQVVATYNDGTTATVSGYELKGALVAGRNVITVEYDGHTATFEAEVTAVVLESITANYGGSDVYTTNTLDDLKHGLTVTAHFTDGSSAEVIGYMLSGNISAGQCTIVVTYGGVETTFTVTVIEPASGTLSVSVDGGVSIYVSSSLDDVREALTVTFDGAVVTDYELSGELTAGTSVITVTYQGNTESVSVTVLDRDEDGNEIVLDRIEAAFKQNGAIVFTSDSVESLRNLLTVTAHYSDGKSKTVEEYELSGDLASAGNGTAVIAVTYGGMVATFNVDVTLVKLEGISVSFLQDKKIYSSTNLDELKSMLTVTGTYTDGTTATIVDYRLSGKLTAGSTSRITVTYGNKTATFDVRVESVTLKNVTVEFNQTGVVYNNIDQIGRAHV